MKQRYIYCLDCSDPQIVGISAYNSAFSSCAKAYDFLESHGFKPRMDEGTLFWYDVFGNRVLVYKMFVV